jgi:hypothetical protein
MNGCFILGAAAIIVVCAAVSEWSSPKAACFRTGPFVLLGLERGESSLLLQNSCSIACKWYNITNGIVA